MIKSECFSPGQLKGLNRLGDVVLPGTDNLPSYSQAGCAAHVDRMAVYLAPDDLAGLKTVLSVCRWLPKPGIDLILRLAAANRFFPGPLGAALRMAEIGLKGVTVSLYYSNLTGPGYTGPRVFQTINYLTGSENRDKGRVPDRD